MINSLIYEHHIMLASHNAHNRACEEMKLMGLIINDSEMWLMDMFDGYYYTDDAQSVFDKFYTEELNNLISK